MKPVRYAVVLAVAYAAVAASYIWLSGLIAARLSTTVYDLARLERLKGLLFVGTTASLLLLASWMLFRRLRGTTEQRERMRQAVMVAQGRVLAGELAAAVAHDFNNALLVVNFALSEARKAPASPRADQLLAEADQTLDYARQLSLQLANTARGQRRLNCERVDLVPVTKSVTRSLSRLPRLVQSHLAVEVGPAAEAVVDVILFEQVLTNLVLNAADAAGAAGSVRVVLGLETDRVRLEVHDSGPGIHVDRRRDVFTAFETTKPEGLGLGLLSVRVAAEMQGGSISLESSPLGGAAFIVRLPLRPQATAAVTH